MGGEGSMMHAIKSFKYNRSLLKKRKLKSKEDVYGKSSGIKLHFKKATSKDIERARKVALESQKKHRTILLVSTLITIAFLALFIWWLS